MNMNLQLFLISFLISNCASISHTHTSLFQPCHEDKPRLEARSIELSKIVKADQDDQKFFLNKTPAELQEALNRDEKRLMALAIDRYLVRIGHKQLFGSQTSKPDMNPKTCWCLEQIENSFPDKLRSEVAGNSLKEAFDWLDDLNKGLSCPKAECQKNLKTSPEGTVPGIW